ncbi:DUF6799 domain-containing protein [Hymenobacter antarcticus]|uniref:DUF6799 domain-containing protein n=1 Tax=Hymenobacter antarcticus TaxID=486270 RepID=A0ABP7PIB2_9BACT
MRIFWAIMASSLLGSFGHPALAQQASNNDGFQRHNGQMQVLRNGLGRPMTRDAHLPTGVTVTKDGFVVSPTGQRTELREGQGCDLRGRPVAVQAAANGRLALAAPASPRSVAPVLGGDSRSSRTLLQAMFGNADDDDDNRFFKRKKYKKHHGKGKGHGGWKGDD